MDTELRKTFLEVSRTRYFVRAAETLYLIQSAVSFCICQLETPIGRKFIHPSPQQYSPDHRQ
jgi:DNA-binding transcriptional LysR family regulator